MSDVARIYDIDHPGHLPLWPPPGWGGGKIAIADSPPVHNAHASQKQMPEMVVFG